MIKNIILVVGLLAFIGYAVERNHYVTQIEEQLIASLIKVDVADSLMAVNTIRGLQLATTLDECQRKLIGIKEKIDASTAHQLNVTVTMYHPVPEQTDSTPNITADGTVFRIESASDYRYIAVAQNMLIRNGGFLDYGDWVVVSAGEKSGLYQVRDTMNKRWVNRIDILESPGVRPYKYNNASLQKLVYNMDDFH